MELIREVSGDISGHSFDDSNADFRKTTTGNHVNNKVKRNNSYSSSILQTPILPNNNTYYFANISDNKNGNGINSTNLNDFMMSRERTVKRDYSYRSSIRRKRTILATDYLQNRPIETASTKNINRHSVLSYTDVARKPTLDPYYAAGTKQSPNPNTVTSSNDGSIRNGNYVHSGSSHTNSFSTRHHSKLGSNEELDINKLTNKLSMSSLATGTSSIAQVSVSRTSQTKSNPLDLNIDKRSNLSTQSSLNIKKVRESSASSNRSYSRNISRTYNSFESKRIVSLNKDRKISQSDKKKLSILQKFEIYLGKFGKFSRRQIIKLKLMLKNMILKTEKLNRNSSADSLKTLSRTASILIQDSRRRNTSARVISRRVTSSLHSGFDPNNTFYNNIMKNEDVSRSGSVRRNLSIKLHDLINERQKSLNLKFENLAFQNEQAPSKALSLRRSPSSMKRAVSTITNNNLKNESIEEGTNSSVSSQQTVKNSGVHRRYEQLGSVKLTALSLEPLEENESMEENVTLKAPTFSNNSIRSSDKAKSAENSVYEDAIEYTEQEMSLISYYNLTSINNGENTMLGSNSVAYKSINHKPSNIRVISGRLNDLDEASSIYSFKNQSEVEFSYNQLKLADFDDQNKQVSVKSKASLIKEESDNSNKGSEKDELNFLLYNFMLEVISRKIHMHIKISKLQALASIQSKNNYHKQTASVSNSNSFAYKNSRNVTRSFSLPLSLK